MGGISYAAPTYYADRLRDRARLYLPTIWSSSNTTLANALDNEDSTHIPQRQADRDLRYRNGIAFDAAAGQHDIRR